MCLYPVRVKVKDERGHVYVGCGKCIECENKRARDFAQRCADEANLHTQICFITLTYNESHVPKGDNLCRRDFTNFIKRLRKSVGVPVRYFGCGEYGSKKGRPHFHLILYGYCFSDGEYMYERRGIKYYRSRELDNFWSVYLGNSSQNKPIFDPIGFAIFSKGFDKSQAFYTSLYMQKRANKDKSVRPFLLSSQRLGLGYVTYISHDGYIYRDGKKILAPIYYRRKLFSDSERLAMALNRKYFRRHVSRFRNADAESDYKDKVYSFEVRYRN